MSKTIFILDAGHGGMVAGSYQTKGKRHTHEDGTTIYEGEFNRAIKARVMERLHQLDIPYVDLNPEHSDLPLGTRVKRANKYHRYYNKNTVLISLHANAGGGEGFEVYTSRQASKQSRTFATQAVSTFNVHFPDETNRGLKRSKFNILYKTQGPAVLLELFFMDNERECKKYLLSPQGRDQIADYVVDCIKNYQIVTQ